MNEIEIPHDLFICQQCKRKLITDNKKLICPICKKEVLREGRFLDFSQLTPKLSLHFAEYTKNLHNIAGNSMNDIPDSWRIGKFHLLLKKYARGSTCLEIGGGDGPLTPKLECFFPNVISLDFSKTFLKRIQSKTKKTICVYGDAHFLPLEDHSIDFVICSEVLEHVCIPTQLLLEIRRVLKPDGICLLSVPNDATSGLFEFLRENNSFASDSHINFFNIPALKKLLFRMGFEIRDLKKISPPVKLSNFYRIPISYLFTGKYYTHILCSLKIMKNPDVYWEKFEKQIVGE